MTSHHHHHASAISFRCVFVAALLCFCGLGVAQGQTVFWSNMDETTSVSKGPSFAVRTTTTVAQSFTTGNTATTLVSITLPIDSISNSGSFHELNLMLYTDSSSLPGTLLETLSTVTDPTIGDNTFTSSASILLAANTTYWWVASADSYNVSSSYTFSMTTGTSGVSPDDWATGEAYFDSYNVRGGNPNAWTSYGDDSFKFTISATAIPEPAMTIALAGLSALGFAACWRRLRR